MTSTDPHPQETPPAPAPPRDPVLLALRAAAFSVLLAQAWIHLFWDAPFRALLWNQDLMTPWVERFLHMDWEQYAATSDAVIARIVRGFGILYAIGAVLAWSATRKRFLQCALLVLVSLSLAGLAFLKYLDHNRAFPHLLEHTAQWASPLLLVLCLRASLAVHHRRLALAIRFAVACAFTGHGLYALGIYPTPAHYFWMTMQCLHTSEPLARTILQVAGALDLAVAAGIFLPFLARPCLVYALIWGALTSTARVVSHFTLAEDLYGLDPWTMETITRLPHALLPLALLLGCWRSMAGDTVDGSSAN